MGTPAWLDRVLNQPVLIYRRMPNGVDEYGNVTYDDVSESTMGFLRPISGSDIQAGRASVGTHILILPAEVASSVDGFARFVVDGNVYEADGPGDRHMSLHADTLHHVEFNVVRTTA